MWYLRGRCWRLAGQGGLRVAAADIGGNTRNLWLTFRKSIPLAAIPERKFDAIRLERFDQVVPVEAAYIEMQVE
ncbi:MAG: hypothetical protein Rhirs2KO_21660 [Rhizobiaceae bacterium]